MKILIANDDGIFAEGIKILANWAKKLGEVTVVAPKTEQSAKSHCLEIRRGFEIKKIDLFEGVEAWVVDSTPADCVRWGIVGLNRKYDLVLSGINRGFNLGTDTMYSGTVAATSEAVAHGHKAIALSTYYNSFEGIEEGLFAVWKYFIDNKLLDEFSFFNVNIPFNKKGIKLTRAGGFYYDDVFVEDEGEDTYKQYTDFKYKLTEDMTVDFNAVMSDYISISPFTVDKTDNAAYEKLLKKLDK